MSDLLGMSDEDFLKLNNAPDPAPANDGATAPVVEDGNETQDEPAKTNDEATGDTGSGADENEGSDDTTGFAGSDGDDGQGGDGDGAEKPADGADGSAAAVGSKTGTGDADPAAAAGKPGDSGEADKAAAKPGDAKEAAEPAVTLPKPEELQIFYQEVMKPFKANGKTVTPRSPEEVIRLMQMGAGFGKKLQDMQPHIKTIRMLEKENLLDPSELSYLIDLRNKNPEAIKKLIKDSNIDPLDLNIEDNVDYTPVNRSVSDAEVAFEDALANLKDRPNGNETIQVINQTWDKESMALLWEQPGLLDVFQTQRENGVYDKIVAELEHQKTFGKIAPSTPFIQAYTIAGDALSKSGRLGQAPSDTPAQVTETSRPAAQPQVIATRTQTPKPVVVNGDKAKAAASTQASPRKAGATVNPLDMPDDVFLKTFAGRL